MKPIRLLCFIFWLYSTLPATAQVESKIESGLGDFFKQHQTEKIYVQTDKMLYTPGETIWYKVYVTAYGIPTALSNMVYIQFIDTGGKIIIQNKLPLLNGQAHGDMKIPLNLAQGNFQVRSFTQWMLNFDENYVFHKFVRVENPASAVAQETTHPVPKTYHIHFFPEGGDCIDSVACHIAFKAVDQDGMPVTVRTTLKDNDRVLSDSIRSIHDGMGKFSLTPLPNHTYYAEVHFPDNSIQTIAMPSAKAYGICMKVMEQTPDHVAVQLTYHEKYRGQYKDIVLAAYQSTGKLATYPLELERNNNLFNIDVRGFTMGILCFTVFDKEGIPEAERIVFLKKASALQLVLISDTLQKKAKAKSTFIFQCKGNDSKISKVNMSVSIGDAERVGEDDYNGNIFSSFFISAELKGYVHHPDYYFSRDDDTVNRALDLVMLTNGWRRFQWEDVLADKPFTPQYPVEKHTYIAGQILNYNPQLFRNVKLKLLIQNEDFSKYIGFAEPDTGGRFMLKDYAAQGKSEVFFQGTGEKSKLKNVKVHFFSSFIDTTSRVPFFAMPVYEHRSAFMLKPDDLDELNDRLAKQKDLLKPVTIRGYLPTKSQQLANRYVGPMFTASQMRDIDLVNTNYPNSISLYDFLRGKFPGLQLFQDADNPFFVLHGTHSFISNQTTPGEPSGTDLPTQVPYIFLDEIQSTWYAVKDIPLSEFALIRYIEPPAPMAPMNGGALGVMAFYIRKIEDRTHPPDITQNYNHYTFNGFSITREFYSPDYGETKSDKTVPDLRSTLYWNHDVTTDENNNIRFSFYNADHPKQFKVIIEGMSDDGGIVYYKKFF